MLIIGRGGLFVRSLLVEPGCAADEEEEEEGYDKDREVGLVGPVWVGLSMRSRLEMLVFLPKEEKKPVLLLFVVVEGGESARAGWE